MFLNSDNTCRFLGGFLTLVMFVVSGPASAIDDANVISDPANFSDWAVVGPNGGDVRVVTIDPRDKDRLYISTLDGQLHTSSDAGKNWKLLANLNEPQLVLDQLFVDSRDSKIIYTSGHRGGRAGGFFKTQDGGTSWKEIKDLRGQSIHAMTQAQYDANILFVGTKNGMWTSRDSGDNWSKIESPTSPLDINSLAVDPKDGNVIYAGTTWRPYKSTDSGKSWRLISNGLIDDSDVFAITINPRKSDHLIASACSGIYESFNGGEKWAKIQGIPSQSRRTRDIVQHPSVVGTVYAGTTEGFWMSVNGGKSWALTTPRNVEVNSIAVHADAPNRVFIGTNNFGVLVSHDGGKNFVPANDKFTSRFTYSVTPDLTERNRVYATTQNTSTSGGFFFTSIDGGTSWTQAKGLDVDRVSPFAVLQNRLDPTQLYLGSNIGIFHSLDRGVSWKLIAPPKPKPVRKAPAGKGKKLVARPTPTPTPVIDAGQELVPVLSEKVKVLTHTEDEKNGIFAGTDAGLYRTYDIKKGWERIAFGEGVNSNVFAVFATPAVPGTIWVGTAASGVIVSTDDGETWKKISGIPNDVPISSITVDPKRPNNIYVGTIHSFYLSRDGGRSWSRRGGNGKLPLGNFTSILIDTRNSDEIFVSSALEKDGGIFYSNDAGMNWKRVDSKEMKLPSRRVWSMAFDPADSGRIFAGSHSSGVYRIDRKTESAGADKITPPTVSKAEI